MIFIKLLELGFFVVLVTLLITQVLIPAIMGRKMFPSFGSQTKLENDLADVNQKISEKELAAIVEKKKAELEALNGTTDGGTEEK